MSEVNDNISVVAAGRSELLELQTFEQRLVDFIGSRGLPTENVLVSVPERLRVFGNVEHVLEKLDPGRRVESAYVSKFLAHRGFNNFYNEPPFARRLAALMKPPAKLPDVIAEGYVLAIVEVFLTNGNGVAVNADPIYAMLLSQLTAAHALIALLSFLNNVIASRLQFRLCQKKFRELLTIVRKIVTAPVAIELIDDIEKFNGPLYQLSADSNIRRKVQSLKTILGIP